jgi:hypothetical protein
MARRRWTWAPKGARTARRALPGSGLRAMAGGRTLPRTPASTGRRARRHRHPGRNLRTPGRHGRASHPCPTQPADRCAATSTRRRRDPPSGPCSLQALSRCVAAWTRRRPRDPPSDPRSLPPVNRCVASSTRRPRDPASDRRTARARTGGWGAGMSMGQGSGALIAPWLRRARTRWTFRRPFPRLGGRRNDRGRLGGRDPSAPGRRRAGGPRRLRRPSRRGLGGGLGW